ncbi:MAG: ATP-binding protein [Candidatus Poribacteria bacterium]|nr:ATP-binding protein [Candidatus Poribacteria bacterium]
METEKVIGTLVGESTSKEFRLAVTPEATREQDIIAVDATLNETENGGELKKIRIWAKVQRIERINPLFPAEAGHELAETQTDPMDTVLSLSREMVSAVCQVIGYEQLTTGGWSGKLESLRYPPKPATRAYGPDPADLKRVLVGKLEDESQSAINIATLSNRDNVDVEVDGNAIVTRHLAILAMTGAGKSWTARRIIEQLADKNYPMVIFDPHGDYTRLGEIESLNNKVNRYHATLAIFEEDADTVAQIIGNLADNPLTPAMNALFGDLFNASRRFNEAEGSERINWLANRLNDNCIRQNGIKPDLWLIANIADAAFQSIKDAGDGNTYDFEYLKHICWENLKEKERRDTLQGIYGRARAAASELRKMERVNQRITGESQPMPQNRDELVQYGKISVISLAGYTGDFQATIYSIIAEELFEAKVNERLQLPFLLLLEEAHNFIPSRGTASAQKQSIAITKQIAREGRKFHVGLVVISQRPSRLDETTLSQCNSYIIMRMVNPADQTFVKRVVESLGEEEASLLPNLEVGEALLSGQMVNFPILVKMKEPEFRGGLGNTNAFLQLEEVHDREVRDPVRSSF